MNETVTDDKYVNYKEVIKQLINDIKKFKRNIKNFIH